MLLLRASLLLDDCGGNNKCSGCAHPDWGVDDSVFSVLFVSMYLTALPSKALLLLVWRCCALHAAENNRYVRA